MNLSLRYRTRDSKSNHYDYSPCRSFSLGPAETVNDCHDGDVAVRDR